MKINFKPGLDFLKIVAILSMVCDHVNHVIFNRAYWQLTAIGRLAFPLFAFILVYNFYYHTHDQLKYLKRLLIFAAISQPVFSLVIAPLKFNIFVTLSLALATLYLFNRPTYKYLPFLLLPVVWVLGYNLHLPDMDYGLLGVLMVYSFGLFIKDYKIVDGVLAVVFLSLINLKSFSPESVIYILSTLCIIPTILFSKFAQPDNILRKYKYWFYVFYPAHLLVLWVIKMVLM